MKALSIFFALFGLFLLGGCDGHRPDGPIGPSEIPFNLVIPATMPAGDYYAISGISVQKQLTGGIDSLTEGTSQSFYAEFYTAPGGTLPASVSIDGNQLVRNLQTDTLRLDAAVGLQPFGANSWSLSEAGEGPSTFTSAFIPAVDSVRPFRLNQPPLRGDTSLTIQWKPAGTNVGMQLRWVGPSRTYTQAVNDFAGSFTVPKEIMATLRGKGLVTLTRFRTTTEQYRGKNLIVARLAQNIFEVTVAP
jgi:hypothetical protein